MALALLRTFDLPLSPQGEGAGGRGRSGATATTTLPTQSTHLHLKIDALGNDATLAAQRCRDAPPSLCCLRDWESARLFIGTWWLLELSGIPSNRAAEAT